MATRVVGTAQFRRNIPAVRATSNSNETVPSPTAHVMTYDDEAYDTAFMHSESTTGLGSKRHSRAFAEFR